MRGSFTAHHFPAFALPGSRLGEVGQIADGAAERAVGDGEQGGVAFEFGQGGERRRETTLLAGNGDDFRSHEAPGLDRHLLPPIGVGIGSRMNWPVASIRWSSSPTEPRTVTSTECLRGTTLPIGRPEAVSSRCGPFGLSVT